MTTFGFIILRHVNSKDTDKYWKFSYKSIRKYYPTNNILIIDDNSNYDYIDTNYENTLINTKIIKSGYPGRGELLPYLYYITNKHCDIACIIHDSVFINKKFTEENIKTSIKLWDFRHNWDQPKDENRLLSSLDNNSELITLHNNKNTWRGCFGGMSIINYDLLTMINDNHNLFHLTEVIKNRYNRMSFERVIAVILEYYETKCINDTLINSVTNHDKKKLLTNNTIFGDIHNYCPWGIKFNKIHLFTHLPVIKVWTGR